MELYFALLEQRQKSSIFRILETCTLIGKLSAEEAALYYLFLKVYFEGDRPFCTQASVYAAITGELSRKRKGVWGVKSLVSSNRTDFYRTLAILEELRLIIRTDIKEDVQKRPHLKCIPQKRKKQVLTYQPGSISAVPLRYCSSELDAKTVFFTVREALEPLSKGGSPYYHAWKEAWNIDLSTLELRCNDLLREIEPSLSLSLPRSKELTLEEYERQIVELQDGFEQDVIAGKFGRALARVICGNGQTK